MFLPETLKWLRQASMHKSAAHSLVHLDHIKQLDALRESLETALKRITALELRLTPGAVELAAEADEPDDDDEPQTLHSVALGMVETLPILPEIKRTLRQAIREPMGLAAAAPVATDEELRRIWEETPGFQPQAFRAIYNLGRQHGTPPAVVEALRKAEAALSGAGWPSSQALNALPAIRAALQLLDQPAPAAAPEPEPEAEAPVAYVEACLVDQIRRHAPMAIGTAEAIIYVVAAWLDRRGNRGSANELREEAARQEGQADG